MGLCFYFVVIMLDLFNQNNIRECTKTDFLDTNIYKSKDHSKEKKMLHKLSRSRLKRELKKDILKARVD